VQFTTSRYQNFTAHLANATGQLAGASGATPIRNYVAAVDPVTWLAGQTTPAPLAGSMPGAVSHRPPKNSHRLVATFDPLADDLSSGSAPVTNGVSALVVTGRRLQRTGRVLPGSEHDLNGLITALGHPEMAANMRSRRPDTEISFFTDATGLWIEAILIQSPEPLPWQRILAVDPPLRCSHSSMPHYPCGTTMGPSAACALELLRGIFNLSMDLPGESRRRGAVHHAERHWGHGRGFPWDHQDGPPLRRIPRTASRSWRRNARARPGSEAAGDLQA